MEGPGVPTHELDVLGPAPDSDSKLAEAGDPQQSPADGGVGFDALTMAQTTTEQEPVAPAPEEAAQVELAPSAAVEEPLAAPVAPKEEAEAAAEEASRKRPSEEEQGGYGEDERLAKQPKLEEAAPPAAPAPDKPRVRANQDHPAAIALRKRKARKPATAPAEPEVLFPVGQSPADLHCPRSLRTATARRPRSNRAAWGRLKQAAHGTLPLGTKRSKSVYWQGAMEEVQPSASSSDEEDEEPSSSEYSDSEEDSEGPRRGRKPGRGGGGRASGGNHQAQRPSANAGGQGQAHMDPAIAAQLANVPPHMRQMVMQQLMQQRQQAARAPNFTDLNPQQQQMVMQQLIASLPANMQAQFGQLAPQQKLQYIQQLYAQRVQQQQAAAAAAAQPAAQPAAQAQAAQMAQQQQLQAQLSALYNTLPVQVQQQLVSLPPDQQRAMLLQIFQQQQQQQQAEQMRMQQQQAAQQQQQQQQMAPAQAAQQAPQAQQQPVDVTRFLS